ncbi:heat shock factor protein 5-like [Erpetoichthys calabaricus]|uniref:heat shock factor protein 5-like n=1 Tax=Erpetoichthys calabaricus TaxID=27687 RepID=UPI0022345406|nr:heat shock factor protein 5-like [Erpetoichthys calabaricus]
MQNCVQLMQYFRCRFIDTLLPRGSYSSRLADLPDVPKENAELSARTWALGVSRSCRHPVGIMNANHLRRCPSVTADGLPVPMLDVCPTKLHDVLLSVPTKNSKFPIKLWQLVNNSTTESIIWDSKGEGVIINQHLFERELLSPVTVSETLIDVFKATNFRSFIRQMNLYGFRKLDVSTRDNNLKTNVGSAQSIAERVFHRHTDNILSAGTVKRDCCTEVQINEKAKEVKLHHYHHPSFKKKHPELLVNVTRSKCKVSIVRVKKLMDPNKQQSNQKEKILLDVVNSSKDESMKKCGNRI